MTKLREKAEEYGRDPAGLSCTTVVALFSLAEVPERGRRPYTGSIPQIIQDLAALAEAGVDEVILTLPFLAGSGRSWPTSPPRSAGRSSKQASDGHRPVRR
jgi:hypothetical protein